MRRSAPSWSCDTDSSTVRRTGFGIDLGFSLLAVASGSALSLPALAPASAFSLSALAFSLASLLASMLVGLVQYSVNAAI